MTIYFIYKVVCWIIYRSSTSGDSKIWGLTGDAGKLQSHRFQNMGTHRRCRQGQSHRFQNMGTHRGCRQGQDTDSLKDSKIWGLTGDAGKDSLTDSKIWGLTGDAGKLLSHRFQNMGTHRRCRQVTVSQDLYYYYALCFDKRIYIHKPSHILKNFLLCIRV